MAHGADPSGAGPSEGPIAQVDAGADQPQADDGHGRHDYGGTGY
jgi:hypothetical protein